MNNAKKIIKNNGLAKEDKKETKKVETSRKNLILIIIGIVVALGCVALVCFIQFRPREILTVEGKDKDGKSVTNTLYYPDAMYDIYTTETMYNMYGMDWDQEDNDGNLMSETAKKTIMDTLKQREILYMEANKNSVTLDDSETKKVDEDLESTTKNMADDQKSMKGLSESDIRSVLEKQAIADKYKEQLIDGFDIDDDALKAKVSKKDYRQYTLQYYKFSKKEDASGDDEAKDKDAKTLEKGKKDLESLRKKALNAKDFTKDLITDSDSDNKDDNNGIEYGTEDLVETDTSFLDDNARKTIKKMKNDQISNIIESDDGYYVIKMVNNNDPAAYNSQCEQVISDEENSRYEDYYKNTLAPTYKASAQEYWKKRIEIGHITTSKKSS